MIDKNNNQIFYLIPSGDGINSILVAELNEKFSTYITKGENNLCKVFYECYPKLEPVKAPENKSEDHVIWIPCFKNGKNSSYTHPHCMRDVVIKREDTDYKISHLDEFENFGFGFDSQYKNSFKIQPDLTKDILINKTFFIAIINLDILSELNIPAIFVSTIKESLWLKE